MTVTREITAEDLKYRDQLWSGAVDTVKYLTEEEVEQVLDILQDCTADDEPWSETQLNDFFMFDTDTIADWLGYENFDKIVERGGADMRYMQTAQGRRLEERYRLLCEAYEEAQENFGTDPLIIARLTDQISDVLGKIDDLEDDLRGEEK